MSSLRRRTCRRSVPGTRRNRWSRTACAYRWRAQPRRTLAARPARVESREDPPRRRRPSEVPSTVGRRGRRWPSRSAASVQHPPRWHERRHRCDGASVSRGRLHGGRQDSIAASARSAAARFAPGATSASNSARNACAVSTSAGGGARAETPTPDIVRVVPTDALVTLEEPPQDPWPDLMSCRSARDDTCVVVVLGEARGFPALHELLVTAPEGLVDSAAATDGSDVAISGAREPERGNGDALRRLQIIEAVVTQPATTPVPAEPLVHDPAELVLRPEAQQAAARRAGEVVDQHDPCRVRPSS